MLMLNLPEAKYFLSGGEIGEEIKLVVAGGRAPAQDWLTGLPAWTTVCADRGVDYALAAGRRVALLVGDGDSGKSALYAEVAKTGVVQQHPVDKDDTDLQLLLQELEKESCHLVVTGVFGGRLDHLQSALRSLIAYKKRTGKQVLLADGTETLAILFPGELCIADVKTQKLPILSVLAFKDNSVATADHLRWPLNKTKLDLDHPYTLSNRPLDEEMWTQCDEGKIGMYLCFEEGGL